MIHDLDKTLEELLKRELPPSLVGPDALTPVAISFAPPDDDFSKSVSRPAIDLFLYDVRENLELRNNEWIVDRSSATITKQRAPTRVDCSYLITAWASESISNPSQDEHRILGEVMRVLLRHAILPAQVLQGDLRDQEPPLPASTLQPGRLQSLGEFWQALGGKPKAALNYTVTIGVPAEEEVVIGPPVTDKQTPGQRRTA